MDEFASRSSARLFLAAVPDAGTAERIHQLAWVLKRAHRFGGKLIAPERLHISLFALSGLPEGHLCAVWEAAMDVRTEPFEVLFDRTASFRGRTGNCPFVLIGGKGLQAAVVSANARRCDGATRAAAAGRHEFHAACHVVVWRGWRRRVSDRTDRLDGQGVRTHPQLERPRTPRTMASVGM